MLIVVFLLLLLSIHPSIQVRQLLQQHNTKYLTDRTRSLLSAAYFGNCFVINFLMNLITFYTCSFASLAWPWLFPAVPCLALPCRVERIIIVFTAVSFYTEMRYERALRLLCCCSAAAAVCVQGPPTIRPVRCLYLHRPPPPPTIDAFSTYELVDIIRSSTSYKLQCTVQHTFNQQLFLLSMDIYIPSGIKKQQQQQQQKAH